MELAGVFVRLAWGARGGLVGVAYVEAGGALDQARALWALGGAQWIRLTELRPYGPAWHWASWGARPQSLATADFLSLQSFEIANDPPPPRWADLLAPVRREGRASPMMTRTPRPSAAVSFVEKDDGTILVVWNQRYRCWTLPGGMVEEGETLEAAQARELAEECGVTTRTARLVYDAPAAPSPQSPERGGHVYVFLVTIEGSPIEAEAGSEVAWVTRADFLSATLFRPFYERFFAAEAHWCAGRADL
jgi:ADP-ribose pyrophosphatase YjhB (NUDIX family)